MNGKLVPKILTYGHGTATLYEKLSDQLHTFQAGDNEALFDSILLLGFGKPVSVSRLTEVIPKTPADCDLNRVKEKGDQVKHGNGES